MREEIRGREFKKEAKEWPASGVRDIWGEINRTRKFLHTDALISGREHDKEISAGRCHGCLIMPVEWSECITMRMQMDHG